MACSAVLALIFFAGVSAVRVRRDPGLLSCGAKGRSTSASSEPNISIVNGKPAAECEWRWQVTLSDHIGHFCGGMLITPEWVLSAAHCQGGTFDVVAGQHDLSRASGKEQTRAVERTIPHPQYDRATTDWDFMLLKVDTPFDMNDCVGTVCLPDSDVRPGTSCWITGWGTLSSGGPGARVLQEGEVQIVSSSDCGSYGPGQITNAMLCAQGRNNSDVIDACQGDSGGPLVCQSGGSWFIHGATSWGYGCADKDYPGVWAKVTSALSWINGIVGSPSPPRRRSSSPPRRRSSPPRRRSSGSGCNRDNAGGPFAPGGDCKCDQGYRCRNGSSAKYRCPYSGGMHKTKFLPSCDKCHCAL